MTSEQRTICYQLPQPGSIAGDSCPSCGHNNLLHSRAQPCVACTLLAEQEKQLSALIEERRR